MKTLHRLILISTITLASDAALAQGNATAGKTLHEAQCNACHAKRFDGDGGKIYTRSNRRVKSPGSLAQMIGACNSNLGLGLFPEDEANLAAYLNQRYYKFKP